MKRMKRSVILWIFLSAGIATAILDGDMAEWDRNGHVVKVLAKGNAKDSSTNTANSVQNCMGSLITPSLVLTAPQCVVNLTTKQQLDRFQVIISRVGPVNGGDKAHLLEAELLHVDADWALLTIDALLSFNEVCPPDPAPKRIARLPVSPSLSKASIINVNRDAFSASNCYMTAFQTHNNPKEFANLHKQRHVALRLPLEQIQPPKEGSESKLFWTRVVLNNTACMDDTGAALFCHLASHNDDFQVGMFRYLSLPVDLHVDKSQLQFCTQATEMQFSMLTGNRELIDVIQRHNIYEFIETYRMCNFIH